MQAVALFPDEGTVRVIDRPVPDPASGEALVRTLRVGIDGSDRRIVRGEIGDPPTGENYLVLGHEAVGVVEDPNNTDLDVGQVVVPTVRRPTEKSAHFERGEPDMAVDGEYVERGIVGAHGFMAEYFTSPVETLVPIPDEQVEYGFLVEPMSICEKALDVAFASRSAFTWHPESALVLGNGSLGLLGLIRLAFGEEFDRTYCLGRRDRPNPSIAFIERVGATYVDARETTVPQVADVHEPMDFIYEATGHAPHALETVASLAPNGVGALQGIPSSKSFSMDGGRFHRDMVVHNKALVGNVNSRASHFEAAAETLGSLPEWVFDDLVTGVYRPDDTAKSLADDDEQLKTAVEFDR
ncbi:glucose 1-dehydrogenase [Haladaptatus halobius]|uniref:glucose 1-dehydrogenase n=1 Tax=Haladaptatus halobius TaxID=2884875 RepID=UPI001D0BD4C7|nr:glucose 1-dehydrogenase [Haladaptatus halobius]